jgi:hypothetical protein
MTASGQLYLSLDPETDKGRPRESAPQQYTKQYT